MGVFTVGLLCLQVLFRLEEKYELKIPGLHDKHCDGVMLSIYPVFSSSLYAFEWCFVN